jgi:hypothetical protein
MMYTSDFRGQPAATRHGVCTRKALQRWTLLMLVALLSLAGGLAAHAQVGTATVSGTVEDITGAAIPGATVLLTDTETNAVRSLRSDGSGFFSFPNLPARTYSATFRMSGFAPLERRNIAVHIGDNLSIPAIRMQIESSSQSVTVTAEPDNIVPTTSGESSYTLSSKQIQNIQVEGRSALELLELVPGAANSGNFTSNSYSGQTAGFGSNGSGFSVNGNRFDQTQIVSDGATVTDVQTAGGAAVTPNIDMIAEAKVQTAAFLPENPNGPIVVNTETKSGGSNFHGEAYAYVRSHVLDDTDWRVKHLGLPKPTDAYYYPGANIGGPLYIPGTGFNKNHDKLFFFTSFEKALQYVQDPLLDIREAVTPTAANRMGDFSNTAYMNSLNSSASYATVTPCSTGFSTAFCSTPGHISPAAINPSGQAEINALPLPNADPATHDGYNLITSVVTFQPRDQEMLKIDANLSNSNHLSARYDHESESVPFPFGYYNSFTPNAYPGGQYGHNTSQSITGNLSTAFTPSLTNQLIASYTQLGFKSYLHNVNAVSRSTNGYTAPDLYADDSNILPNVQPQYGNGAYASLYLIGGSYPTVNHPQQTYTVNDNVTKTLRAHTLKAGFYFAQQQFSERTQGSENSTLITGEYGGAANVTGNAFADILVGQIQGYAQSTANFTANMLQKRIDFFVQDEWKLTPRFTLNYGVRVNHIGAWYETSGRIVVFDPALYNSAGTYAQAPGLVDHATTPSVSISGGHPLGFQIAPDLGFAYDILGTGNTIVRGGFGTNYYSDPGQNAFSGVQAPPNESFTTYYTSGGAINLSQIPTINTYAPVGAYGIANRNDTHTPVTRSYTMAVDQSYAHGLSTELAYSGNVSKFLTGYVVSNAVPEGCAGEYPGYTPGTYADQQCRPYPLLGGLSTLTHNLSSFYNALQAQVSKHTGVVNFWATYTYGKTMAYNCENPFVERRCYGPAAFDRSQNFNLSYLVNLPSVSAKHLGNHAALNAILDGWQFSGIEILGTGNPLEFTGEASANGNTGNEYDGYHNRTITTTSVGPGYPNLDNRVLVGTPDEEAVPTLICDPRQGLHAHQYFNAACFAEPAMGSPGHPSLGTYNLPYIHGPRLETDDIGLYKAFKFRDQRSVQFKAQAFNVFNHPSDTFQQYDTALQLPYGTQAAPGQTVLPTATNGTNGPGYAQTKLGSRTIQLEGKLFF